jgi:type VII secretion protein EccB
MQTRSDQAQAYRFTTRRIVSALLTGEPETAERPMRRFGMSMFGSIMVAAIVFAAVGIVGFLFPSGAKLTNKAIVLERETGATYIFEGGLLYPVRNFTSARLALESDKPQISRVSAKSLRGIPRGPLVGIPDLPDSLPDPNALIRGAWSVCSRPRDGGSSVLHTDVVVGGPRPDGTPLGDQAVLVQYSVPTAAVEYHMLWRGRRLRADEAAITALGMTTLPRTEVTTGLLNSIPPGPPLAPPSSYQKGGSGADIDGSPGILGDVYEEAASGRDFVLTDNGLKQIGRVMKNLLLAAGAQRHDVSLAAVTANPPRDGRPFQDPGFPDEIPKVAALTNPQMICAVTAPSGAPDDSGIETYLYERMPDVSLLRQVPGSGSVGSGTVKTAEFVQMTAGEAALVKALPAPGDVTQSLTTYLVAQGYKFPLSNEGVKAFLGYGAVAPTAVPVFMLALLPTANVLDPKAAGSGIEFTDSAGGLPGTTG